MAGLDERAVAAGPLGAKPQGFLARRAVAADFAGRGKPARLRRTQRVCVCAGNYGANLDTLRALARLGIALDTSYNAYYLDSQCELRMPELLLQPRQIDGVWEIPISCFQDWPGHYRHAQLCACTFSEMKESLLSAWRAGWKSFVIVSHGFELIRRRKQIALPPLPDHFVRRRFERLCGFLAEHRDKFRTRGFSDIEPQTLAASPEVKPLRSPMRRTAGRYVEQLVRRMA